MVDRYPGEDKRISIPDFEKTPLSRSEYISALVHLYRGELHRATLWRIRLDTTTNWSIISVMGLVTFSLSEPSHSHAGILAGMALVMTFLSIEARRFRFFDVWRARTRMLEENFMGPLLRRDLESPISGWGDLVAEDLLHPAFKISYQEAIRARLMRNYVPLFVLLAICWVLKLTMHEVPPHGDANPFLNAMWVGALPWWVSLFFVCALYLYLIIVALFVSRSSSPEEEYWGKGQSREMLHRIDL